MGITVKYLWIDGLSRILIINEIPYFSTMCFMNEIPEKEQALKPKKMEKEKQQEDKSQHEEKPIMVNTA